MNLKDKAQAILASAPMGRRELAKRLNVTAYKAGELLKEIHSHPIGPRIAYFDIETTGFKPELQRIVCAVILSYPSMEYNVFRLDEIKDKVDFTDDRELCLRVRDCLEQHHLIVTWYGKGFDVPFLNTRLVQNGERKLRNHLHLDPYYYHKGWHGVKPRRASLEAVGEFYGLDERKMQVDTTIWAKVVIGDKEAMDTIVERCKSDALMTAGVTEKAFEADLVKNITRYA
jgi:uncharacterized protein YprB with RNaseH-like and TPR domain